jgi:surface antigen
MRAAIAYALAFVGICVGACSGGSELSLAPKEETRGAFGGLAGAPVVPRIGLSTSSRATDAAADGQALSALIGTRIGAALDDEDRQRAYAAQMQALENGQPGAPVSWRNTDSGRWGTVVPGPTYQRGDGSCRQFSHTIYIDAKPQTARGTACRFPDGTWSPIS